MQKALLVGGDRSDGFEKAFAGTAHALVGHWHGRRPKEARRALPVVDLVVVVWDRVSHPLAESVRAQAASLGVEVVYCRSSSDLRRKLAERDVARPGAKRQAA